MRHRGSHPPSSVSTVYMCTGRFECGHVRTHVSFPDVVERALHFLPRNGKSGCAATTTTQRRPHTATTSAPIPTPPDEYTVLYILHPPPPSPPSFASGNITLAILTRASANSKATASQPYSPTAGPYYTAQILPRHTVARSRLHLTREVAAGPPSRRHREGLHPPQLSPTVPPITNSNTRAAFLNPQAALPFHLLTRSRMTARHSLQTNLSPIHIAQHPTLSHAGDGLPIHPPIHHRATSPPPRLPRSHQTGQPPRHRTMDRVRVPGRGW